MFCTCSFNVLIGPRYVASSFSRQFFLLAFIRFSHQEIHTQWYVIIDMIQEAAETQSLSSVASLTRSHLTFAILIVSLRWWKCSNRLPTFPEP